MTYTITLLVAITFGLFLSTKYLQPCLKIFSNLSLQAKVMYISGPFGVLLFTAYKATPDDWIYCRLAMIILLALSKQFYFDGLLIWWNNAPRGKQQELFNGSMLVLMIGNCSAELFLNQVFRMDFSIGLNSELNTLGNKDTVILIQLITNMVASCLAIYIFNTKGYNHKEDPEITKIKKRIAILEKKSSGKIK